MKKKFVLGDTILELILPFNEKGFEFISAKEISRNLLPDRFGPINKSEIELVSNADTINYLCWTYSDSIKTMNAFYNWIDNFGEESRKSFFIGGKNQFSSKSIYCFRRRYKFNLY